MQEESSLLKDLVEAFRGLPGIGVKTAQRMAFHILEHDRSTGLQLASALNNAIENVGHCQRCRTLTEHDYCRICSNLSRDRSRLCIVEHPSDVVALEQATHYTGQYFVLMGNLSPLDAIGPDELGLPLLEQRLREEELQEIILATSSTVEGEVTAHYISEMATKYAINSTRIAQGVPAGGALDYLDNSTLVQAFDGRREY